MRTSMTAIPVRVRRAAVAVASVGAVAAGSAPAALAASGPAASPAHIQQGSYKTWAAAQKAAGFQLLKPASTSGLKLAKSGINVLLCPGYVHARVADVVAVYGSASRHEISLEQDNGRRECDNFGESTPLGTYKVHGATARLLGACDLVGSPSCRSRHIWMELDWISDGRHYKLLTHSESRKDVVSLARHLVRVG